MKVVIDHREPELFRALFDETDEVSVATLHVGDFRVNDEWLFERKTVSDFAISLVDGRLFTQALEFLRRHIRAVYILEGTASDFARAKIRRESVQGAMVTLSVFWGFPVLRSSDPAETVRLMRYTVNQHRRVVEGGVERFGYRPKGERARKLYVLQGLPGIGKERAKALLDHFGSVEAVMTADIDALSAVSGIGNAVARGIRALLMG